MALCLPVPLRTLCLGLIAVLVQLPAWSQTITVYSSGSIAVGSSRQLSAYVPLAPNGVIWSVNGVPGGDELHGTISSAGLYRAPAALPSINAVEVRATSVAKPGVFGAATLTITQVQPRLWNASPGMIAPGAFTLTLNGANFSDSAVAWFGNQKLATTRLSATQLRASGTATAAQLGSQVPVLVEAAGPGAVLSETVNVRISQTAPPTPPTTPPPPPPAEPPTPDPGQGTANLAAARFLEQATFGPTPAEVQRLRQLGIPAWLDEQFAMPESVIPNPGGQASGEVRQQYLHRLSAAPDQLRQRVAHALGQLLVISMNKNIYPDEIVPHLRTLSRHAFGNYRALLGEVATSSQMGKYLDLANSTRPSGMRGANENFARELLQLFTIGLVRLNPDGRVQLDSAGRPIPAYDQGTIQQVALALTGWTYIGSGSSNWENFAGPLVVRDTQHDFRAKSFLGCQLPAGQGAQADMEATLDCAFNHPNTPPFVATRLIRSLVKSNPSPAYVRRVAAAFENNGSGRRGDLRAVVRAVLTDAEARQDAPVSGSGRLREPLLHLTTLLRALGGGIAPGNQLSWELSRMSQAPLTPPSVFGHYSPLFRLPADPSLHAPEFQIYTPTEAVLRGNLIWRLFNGGGTDAQLDITPFVAAAGSGTTALIDRVDQALLWGRMPAAMRQSLATAVAAQPDARQRALTALYLTALSGLHAVQH